MLANKKINELHRQKQELIVKLDKVRDNPSATMALETKINDLSKRIKEKNNEILNKEIDTMENEHPIQETQTKEKKLTKADKDVLVQDVVNFIKQQTSNPQVRKQLASRSYTVLHAEGKNE